MKIGKNEGSSKEMQGYTGERANYQKDSSVEDQLRGMPPAIIEVFGGREAFKGYLEQKKKIPKMALVIRKMVYG